MGYIGKKGTDKPLTSADLNDNIVTSAKILDGTIADADVNDVAGSKLTGTVADARISALTASKLTGALPAISAANLTSIPAGNLTGTVADARISALTSSKLTGALPAIDGSNLTGIAVSYDDNKLQANIALLGFKTAVNGSLAKYSLQDQIIDEFTDATGVDAGASTNENLSSGAYIGATAASDPTSGTVTTPTIDAQAYRVHTFLSSGTFVATGAGTGVDMLVVAGGGGTSDMAGGSGAGGYLHLTNQTVAAGTHTVTVGAGGTKRAYDSSLPGDDGDNSVFGSMATAIGGGGSNSESSDNARDGGSGGGTGRNSDTPGSGTAGPPRQGYDGAIGNSNGYGSGGGGGAGAVGQAGNGGGGDGGVGVQINIDGNDYYWCGGGGGHAYGSGTGGTGGLGGGGGGHGTYAGSGPGGASALTTGGAGGTGPSDSTGHGGTNTGAGGGGGTNSGGAGSDGGSGIVIVRYIAGVWLSGGANLTLQSTDTTSSIVNPDYADMVILMEDAYGTATLNTDIKGYISEDSGVTFTEGVLVDEGSWGTNKKIVAFHDLDVSAQSGTAMCYKITTHNQSAASKETKIHATSIGWKA